MFTPLASLAGGLLIGLSSALLLLLYGRIAGISGITGGALDLPATRGGAWRLLFLAGLIGGGAIIALVHPQAIGAGATNSVPLLIGSGLLVGFGTRLGGGCTSGHGVCGLGRLSPVSLWATLTFMGAAAATVFVVRHVIGSAS